MVLVVVALKHFDAEVTGVVPIALLVLKAHRVLGVNALRVEALKRLGRMRAALLALLVVGSKRLMHKVAELEGRHLIDRLDEIIELPIPLLPTLGIRLALR